MILERTTFDEKTMKEKKGEQLISSIVGGGENGKDNQMGTRSNSQGRLALS